MTITIRQTCLLLLVILGLAGCTPNKQLRTEVVESNCLWGGQDCRRSVLEHYLEHDLAFIEFTERGNLYDRNHAQQVLDLINEHAHSENGTAVFVFVHGWKHNAEFDDSNVTQFREFLSRAAENEIVGKRRVIGLYLGWRGKFTDMPIIKETTYWARKSVAEEIGAGGATEIFSRLNHMLVSQFEDHAGNGVLYKNSFVIIGHSFGGAIVLSALHDVLLKDLIAADISMSDEPSPCRKIKRFADALILLNPAIEANKVVLLKEAAARCVFDDSQAKLMHILSSDGDNATKIFFPIGQYANLTSPLGPKRLKRRVNGKDIILNERQLDLITAGNLQQLRTGFLSYDRNRQEWSLAECRDNLTRCGVIDEEKQRHHFTVSKNDPLAFIKTDRVFIKDHNDAFGCYVQSFITAVIFETQSLDKGWRDNSQRQQNGIKGSQILGCDYEDFDFQSCFRNQMDDYGCDRPS